MKSKSLSWFTLSILILATMVAMPVNIVTAEKINNQDTITLNYSFDMPTIGTMEIHGEEFTRVQLEDLPLYGNIDEPRLPVKPVRILLPQSTTVKKIIVKTSDANTFKLNDLKTIEMGTQSFNLDQEHQKPLNQVLLPTYNQDELSLGRLHDALGIQYFRGYTILHVNLRPVQYEDNTNTLCYYNQMALTIETKQDSINPMYRSSAEEIIKMVDNADALDSYENNNYHTQSSPVYDYVIITTEDLKNANGNYTFDDLITQREGQGLSCTYKTVEEIKSEYNGVDTQEKIRNFIKDAYLNWGTTWILLGGDVHKVPIRFLYDIDGEDGQITSDLYYQCLDGDYNYDGDSHWGEKYDGINGQRVDLYAEVYVGRAPVDDENDISAFVEKTLSYENSEWGVDDFLNIHLAAGETVWNGAGGDGAGYVERCIGHCTDYNQDTYGIPVNAYSIVELYERDMEWDRADVINKINEGVGIINHVGHGSCNGAMKLAANDLSSLLNNVDKYGLFYSQACHAGQLEKQDECIAEAWVNAEKTGGFAAIMNTGLGYGGTSNYDGADNRYAREFFDALFSSQEKISRLGKANQDSKEDNFWRIEEQGMSMYHVYYNTLLFGDPYVQIKGAEGTVPNFMWDPEYPTTGVPISFTDMSTGNIYYREWMFGDGGYSHQKNPTHAYSRSGIFSVTLNIMDDEGYSTSITHEVEVRNYWFPIAIVSYDYNGENEFTLNFFGSDSWDPDGTVASYEWDFDDETTSDLPNPTHEFPAEGMYHVCLMVRDNDDNLGITYCDVSIENQTPPEKPDIPNGQTNGIAGIEYIYTVATTDFEGNNIRYGWDWGDGSLIEWSNYYNSGESCAMSHTWISNGSYNVRVIAKDVPGAASEWSDALTVLMDENDVPYIEIEKPKKSLYLNNAKIFPFFTSIVVGSIDIEVTATDLGGIERVEIFIDDELKANISSEPYVWTWDDRLSFGRHTIEVVGYDTIGSSASDEIRVWKFL